MTITENISSLKKLLSERDEIEDEISLLEVEMAAQISPYQIGDKIEIKSYSYRGKIGVVSKLYLRFYSLKDLDFTFRVYVKVLKKDGSEGPFSADWDQDYDDKLKEYIEKTLRT